MCAGGVIAFEMALQLQLKGEKVAMLAIIDAADVETPKKQKSVLQTRLTSFYSVFSTTDFSYHGHPEPLTCPEGRTRKSLALYYYTNGRPANEVSEPHSTIFRSRPGQDLKEENQEVTLSFLVRKLVPPILLDLKKAITKKD